MRKYWKNITITVLTVLLLLSARQSQLLRVELERANSPENTVVISYFEVTEVVSETDIHVKDCFSVNCHSVNPMGKTFNVGDIIGIEYKGMILEHSLSRLPTPIDIWFVTTRAELGWEPAA